MSQHSRQKGLILLCIYLIIFTLFKCNTIDTITIKGNWYFFDADSSYNELFISDTSFLFYSNISGQSHQVLYSIDSNRIDFFISSWKEVNYSLRYSILNKNEILLFDKIKCDTLKRITETDFLLNSVTDIESFYWYKFAFYERENQIYNIQCEDDKGQFLDGNLIYEEIAVKYLINVCLDDSDNFLSNIRLSYNGLVTGVSTHNERITFEKANNNSTDTNNIEINNLGNNDDFYIDFPDKIQKRSWNEFCETRDKEELYLNVKHYIESDFGKLIQIDLYDNRSAVYNLFFYLNHSGKIMFEIFEENLLPDN